jgi:AcrR family transcriptional regulator
VSAEASGKRRYRSSLRAERATDTRDRIIAAARELFAARGFASTTVAVIAERADVAVPTVYATFANKTAIVVEMVMQLVAEIDIEKWHAEGDSEPDPRRQLDLFARFHRELFARGKDVWAAALDAGGDPAVLEIHAHGARKAKEWLTPIVASLARAGLLAHGLTRQDGVESAWMLCGMEAYFRATRDLGWTDAQYERWLRRNLYLQLTGTA